MSSDPTLWDDDGEPITPTDPFLLSRGGDPGTSHAGAAFIAPHTASQKAKLLDVYRESYPTPLYDEEAGNRAGLRQEASHKRCADLRNDGRIEVVDVVRGPHGTIVRRCRYVWEAR